MTSGLLANGTRSFRSEPVADERRISGERLLLEGHSAGGDRVGAGGITVEELDHRVVVAAGHRAHVADGVGPDGGDRLLPPEPIRSTTLAAEDEDHRLALP